MTTTPEDWCTPDPSQTVRPATVNPLARGSLSTSALCSRGWQPIMLTGLLRDLLTRHFADPATIESPDLRGLIWREGVETGILIESAHRWRETLANKRPAIIIKRNGYKNLRLGMGNYAGANGQGQPRYATMWVGSHTLFCLHGSGAAVEILHHEVVRDMSRFSSVVLETLGLHRWQVTDVGPVSELEEARETFAVPVTVGWAFQDVWLLEREVPRLRKIVLSMLLGTDELNATD